MFEHEYYENPDKEYPINENDQKYIEYSELLMKAIEEGAGYRVEWEDTLYIVPTPLVKIDALNRFHSLTEPAIRWKGGKETYFLSGVSFEKALWKRVVSPDVKASEIFAIENMEQRRIAYELMDKSKMKELSDYKVLDTRVDEYGYKEQIVSFTVEGYDEPFIYLNCFCPSEGREYFLQTDKKKCKLAKMNSFGMKSTQKFDQEW